MIPNCWQKSLNASLSNYFLLSETKSLGIPKQSRDAEAVNDAFLDEVSNILLSDSGQGFYRNPFSEIVNSYDEELELSHCHGEGPHFVEPPLSEWSGSIHWGKLFR